MWTSRVSADHESPEAVSLIFARTKSSFPARVSATVSGSLVPILTVEFIRVETISFAPSPVGAICRERTASVRRLPCQPDRRNHVVGNHDRCWLEHRRSAH